MAKSGYVAGSWVYERNEFNKEINKDSRPDFEIKFTKAKNRYIVHVHQDGKGSWQDSPIEPLIVRKLSSDDRRFRVGDKAKINYNKKYGYWYFD